MLGRGCAGRPAHHHCGQTEGSDSNQIHLLGCCPVSPSRGPAVCRAPPATGWRRQPIAQRPLTTHTTQADSTLYGAENHTSCPTVGKGHSTPHVLRHTSSQPPPSCFPDHHVWNSLTCCTRQSTATIQSMAKQHYHTPPGGCPPYRHHQPFRREPPGGSHAHLAHVMWPSRCTTALQVQGNQGTSRPSSQRCGCGATAHTSSASC